VSRSWRGISDAREPRCGWPVLASLHGILLAALSAVSLSAPAAAQTDGAPEGYSATAVHLGDVRQLRVRAHQRRSMVHTAGTDFQRAEIRDVIARWWCERDRRCICEDFAPS
jgi:hypothetical protein